MSWSTGRKPDAEATSGEKKGISEDHKRKLECIRQINGVLGMLARDGDLQDDLKNPAVRLALDHWTGVRRLPPEVYAKRLENNRTVNSVYPKLMQLQSVCNAAPMKVPLDHMLEGKCELDTYALTTSFGTDFCILHDLTRPLTPKNTSRKTDDNPDHPKVIENVKENKKKKELKELKDLNIVAPVDNSNPKAFSFWKIMMDSCGQANWLEIGVDVFRQQFFVLIGTIMIAIILGFVDLEKLKLW